jgi:hypothetical protein
VGKNPGASILYNRFAKRESDLNMEAWFAAAPGIAGRIIQS